MELGGTGEYWAAVRRTVDEGYEYVDLETAAGTLAAAREIAAHKDRHFPAQRWVAANAVVRFAKIRIEEIEELDSGV
jgi:hypothetical protein